MLFPIFLFNQQYYSHLQASPSVTCVRQEQSNYWMLASRSFVKVPHAFCFFLQQLSEEENEKGNAETSKQATHLKVLETSFFLVKKVFHRCYMTSSVSLTVWVWPQVKHFIFPGFLRIVRKIYSQSHFIKCLAVSGGLMEVMGTLVSFPVTSTRVWGLQHDGR